MIKMFVAGCSRHPKSLNELLEYTRPYDPEVVQSIRSGLYVFDEHNTPEDPATVDTLLETSSSPGEPFRVVNERTRSASLKPTGTGLILLNLKARRIVQVQNSYADVQRSDRGRIRRAGRPTRQLYHYRLPEEWHIVP